MSRTELDALVLTLEANNPVAELADVLADLEERNEQGRRELEHLRSRAKRTRPGMGILAEGSAADAPTCAEHRSESDGSPEDDEDEVSTLAGLPVDRVRQALADLSGRGVAVTFIHQPSRRRGQRGWVIDAPR